MLPKRLSRKVIYESKWVNLYADKVEYPDGLIIEKHHFIHFDYQSVAVIIENENKQILLIKAIRYIAPFGIEWEVPAGGVDKNETSVEAAIREVMEETGYQIKNPSFVYLYNPSNGISDKEIIVFHAKVCVEKLGKTANFNINETLETKWFDIKQIKELIANNKIHCGVSLTTLLLHLNNS